MTSTSGTLLEQLNDKQREAVCETDGPMLILAGAGSGKTRAITFKIAYLIDRRLCRPESILAVTFTNKAASEMKERVAALLRGLDASPLICTFHSFAVRTLRRHSHRIGFENDFTICDAEDQRALYKRVLDEIGLPDDYQPAPRLAQSVISRAKNKGWGPQEYLEKSDDRDATEMARIFEAYQAALKRANAMDFDDLILNTVLLFRKCPDIRDRTSEWHRYLLIDEYQDTNSPQYDLIRLLTSRHDNVTAVGDEDQSIYGFRGADIGNILRFEEDFPGAKVVKLEQNYRSTQVILDAASAVVANNVMRKGKTLWTDRTGGEPIELYVAEDARDEADFAARRIAEFLHSGESRLAVLYRTNFQSRQYEDALRRLNIRYQLVGGQSFYQRKEVKDALAYLRTVRNPGDDVSLLRIINEPARGIGKTTLEGLLGKARENRSSVWEALREALKERAFPARAHAALASFAGLIEKGRHHLELPLHLALDKILETSGYREFLHNQQSEEAENRILNLDELINVAREYADRDQSLQDFLDSTALHADADDYSESAEVTLMTLHNAKGLEFSVVFLAGMEEGLFPHSRSVSQDDVEEERRLCYVGITRARRRLFLSYSRRRRFFGRGSDSGEPNLHSRFLNEIPPELVQVRESAFASRPEPAFFTPLGPRRKAKKYQGKTYNSKESVVQFLDDLQTAKSSRPPFSSGDLVAHRDFGRGRVLRVEAAANDFKVTVQFPGLGIKKLLQSFARLKRI